MVTRYDRFWHTDYICNKSSSTFRQQFAFIKTVCVVYYSTTTYIKWGHDVIYTINCVNAIMPWFINVVVVLYMYITQTVLMKGNSSKKIDDDQLDKKIRASRSVIPVTIYAKCSLVHYWFATEHTLQHRHYMTNENSGIRNSCFSKRWGLPVQQIAIHDANIIPVAGDQCTVHCW